MITIINHLKSLIFSLTLNMSYLIISFKEVLIGIDYGKMSKMWL